MRSLTSFFLCCFCVFGFAQIPAPGDVNMAQSLRKSRLSAQEVSKEVLLNLGAWEEFEQKVAVTNPPATLSNPDRKWAVRYWMLNNDFERAEAFVQNLPQLDPEVKLFQARLHIEAWELDSAEVKLKALENRLPEARFWLGRLQLLRKQYSTALPYARELRSRDREPALGYLLEAEAQLWLRNLPAAEEALERSLELDPFSADARFWYGYVIWRKVDASLLPDMAAQWEFALELNPVHYLTHWHWGNGHTHLTFESYQDKDETAIRKALVPAEEAASGGNLNKALVIAQQVAKEYPSSVIPDLYKASWWYLAFDQKDHLNAAQAIFQRILDSKAHYGPAHNGLAAVIKAKRFTYLAAFDFLTQNLPPLPEDPTTRKRFFEIFPDMQYYPGDRIQRMIWQQLQEGKAYFPLLEKLGRRFVIPPLHTDLALAMENNWFRRGVTFDNRQWMDIRGVGSGATGIEYVMRGAHMERNVTLHEYVHLFHISCFSDREKRRLRQLYAQAMKQGLTLDYYAANNEHEYLAQTYTAYFALVKVHPLNHKSVNTRFDLASKDPALYAWIDTLVQKQRAYLAGDDSVFRENWAEVYVSLAEKNRQTGSIEEAHALIDTALLWAPRYVPALVMQVKLFHQEGGDSIAMQTLRKAVDVVGPKPDLLRQAAALATAGADIRELGDIVLPVEVFTHVAWLKEAYRRETDFSEKANIQASLRIALSDVLRWEEAIEVAEDYAASVDAFSTYLRDRKREAQVFAWSLRSQMGEGETLTFLESAFEQRPQDEALRIIYADALAHQGRFEDAIAILKEGLSLLQATGGRSEAFVRNIALFTALQGDTAQAARLISRFSAKTSSRTVKLLIELERFDEASEMWGELSEAVALDRAEKAWLKVSLLEGKGMSRAARKAHKEAMGLSPYRGFL